MLLLSAVDNIYNFWCHQHIKLVFENQSCNVNSRRALYPCMFVFFLDHGLTM